MNAAGVRARVPWPVLVIVFATVAAYWPGLRAPFLFDDHFSITDNPSIQRLWPLSEVLSPPNTGASVTGRPIVNLSFALNYAVGGLDPLGYHVLNLAVHTGAALLLFGIVRRTLSCPLLAARFGKPATGIALVGSLLWALHPLQTESVTCVVQRTESLMGFFYFLTFHAYLRAAASPAPGVLWPAVAVGACLLGMATKEVMVSAPLLVLLHDRTFVAGSFAGAWRRRRGLIAGLASTWILLGWLVIGSGADRGGTSGFGTDIAWWQYALTQAEAVTRYLALSLWPHPLVLDYGTDVSAISPGLLAQLVLILGLGGASAVALWRWPAWGFAGAWFFAILAPSSSVVPLATQTIAEHRMYLSLAAVLVPLLMIAHLRWGRRALLLGAAVSLVFGVLTWRRNVQFQSLTGLWEDNVALRPQNLRARHNLGQALHAEGRLAEARPHFEASVGAEPTAQGHVLLGLTLIGLGHGADGLDHLRAAARLAPGHFETQVELATALLDAGVVEEGRRALEAAVMLVPARADAHMRVGRALAMAGAPADALRYLQQAVALDARLPDARIGLGNVLFQFGRLAEAESEYRAALRLRPDGIEARYNLALVLVQQGRTSEALAELEALLRIDAGFAPALGLLGELKR